MSKKKKNKGVSKTTLIISTGVVAFLGAKWLKCIYKHKEEKLVIQSYAAGAWHQAISDQNPDSDLIPSGLKDLYQSNRDYARKNIIGNSSNE